MPDVISDARDAFDHGRNPGQRPEIGLVALRLRPIEERPLHAMHCVRVQSRGTTGRAGLTERRSPLPLEPPPPDHRGLPAHTEQTSHLRLRLSLREQTHRLTATTPQCLQILASHLHPPNSSVC